MADQTAQTHSRAHAHVQSPAHTLRTRACTHATHTHSCNTRKHDTLPSHTHTRRRCRSRTRDAVRSSMNFFFRSSFRTRAILWWIVDCAQAAAHAHGRIKLSAIRTGQPRAATSPASRGLRTDAHTQKHGQRSKHSLLKAHGRARASARRRTRSGCGGGCVACGGEADAAAAAVPAATEPPGPLHPHSTTCTPRDRGRTRPRAHAPLRRAGEHTRVRASPPPPAGGLWHRTEPSCYRSTGAKHTLQKYDNTTAPGHTAAPGANNKVGGKTPHVPPTNTGGQQRTHSAHVHARTPHAA